MAIGLGMRTIWISLRAINYTDRAFRQAMRNVNNLSKAERIAAEGLMVLRAEMMATIMAGIMFAAMGAMVMGTMIGMMGETRIGAAYMEEFNAEMAEAKIIMADTFFVIMRPALDILKAFISLMERYPVIARLVGVMAALAGVLLTVYGAYLILKAVRELNLITTALELGLGQKVSMYWGLHAVTINGVTVSYWLLAGAIAGALVGFILMYQICQKLGRTTALIIGLSLAIVGLAIAIAMLRGAFGDFSSIAGVLAVGALGAGAGAIISGMEQHQMGTRGLRRTGPVWAHKGEVIYNPATRRPTQIANDLERGRQPSMTRNDIDITIENVHTKADFEDLDEELREALFKSMRERR